MDGNGRLYVDGNIGGGVSSWNDLTDKPTIFPTDWDNVAGKPTVFTPASHKHDEYVLKENTYWGTVYNDYTASLFIKGSSQIVALDGYGNGKFVKIAGDTMTGDLTISKSVPSLILSGSRKWSIYESGGDLGFKNNGILAGYFSGTNNGNFVLEGTFLAKGDVVAYSEGFKGLDIPVGSYDQYGLVRIDNKTIKTDSYGRLYVAEGSGGGGSSAVWLPSVDTSGNISWSLSTSTTAPTRRNIKGQPGNPGPKGQGVAYQWSGTSLRLGTIDSNGYTSWGGYVNLQGPAGSGGGGSSSELGSDVTISSSGTVFRKSGNDIGIKLSGGNSVIGWHRTQGVGNLYLNYVSSSTNVRVDNKGKIYSNGSVVTSDMRLKDKIADVTNVLDSLSELNAFIYTFKLDEDRIMKIGLSAQDVKKVFPQAVTLNYQDNYTEAYYGIDYAQVLTAVSVNGLKELHQLVLNQNNVIKYLRKEFTTKVDSAAVKINSLERRVAKLEGGAA